MSKKVKSETLRRCVGCGQMKPKAELIRVAKTPDGEIVIDPDGKSPGRGAYVCKCAECVQTAQKRRQLERALSKNISDETYALLKEAVGK